MRRAFVAAYALLVGAHFVGQVPLQTASAQPAEPSQADRAQAEKIVHQFHDAWNRHDMAAFAALFHDDAEWVHWRGGLWSGKQAIHDGHKAVHDTYYATSQATLRSIEAVHFLTPTVAYLRVRSDMTGDAVPRENRFDTG